MPTDEQAIRDLVSTWLRASRSGDNETVLRLMAEDVVFLLPGRAPMRGREAFRAAQRGAADFAIEATGDIQEIRVFGEWAYCWNRLTVTMTPRSGGNPSVRAGDVLSILRKDPGGWVIVRDANMLAPVGA